MLQSVITEAEARTGSAPTEQQTMIALKWAQRNDALQGRTEEEKISFFRERLFPQIIRRERFYRADRVGALKTLDELFKACSRSAGYPVGSKIPVGGGNKAIVGQPGTNMADLAQYVLYLNLGIDVTAAAKRYDELRPEYNFRKPTALDRPTKGDSKEQRAEIKKYRQDHQTAAEQQYLKRVNRSTDKVTGASLFDQEFESWGDARRQIATMAKAFVSKVKADVDRRFSEVYPESYWEFLSKQDDGKVYYTSEAAVPISIGALNRATKVSTIQTTVKDYFIDIQAKISRAIERASNINVKDMDQYRQQIFDVVQSLNDDLDPTGGLSITLRDIDTRMNVSDVVSALDDVKSKLLGRIGKLLLRKCMDADKIPADDAGIISATMACDQPMGGQKFAGGTFAFSLGFEGRTPRALGFTLERYHSGERGEADWARPRSQEPTPDPEILKKYDRDPARGDLPTGSSNPNEEVFFQFKAPWYLSDDSNEEYWMAVRLRREEIYARGLKGNVVSASRTVDEALKDQLDNYQAVAGQNVESYNRWSRYGATKFRNELIEAFKTGKVQDLVDQTGVPVEVKDSPEIMEKLAAEGEDSLRRRFANRFTTMLFLREGRMKGSQMATVGYFPSGTIVIGPKDIKWENQELVPVFFTDESVQAPDQQQYNELTKYRPWPNYADDRGQINPEKPVAVNYIGDDGEEKEEILTARQVYQHGLDKRDDVEIVGDKTQKKEVEILEEPIFFFTDLSHTLDNDGRTSGVTLSTDACPLCSIDTEVYHAAQAPDGSEYRSQGTRWDPRLELQGRKAQDLIKITYSDPNFEDGNIRTVVIRRHELFDRNDEISDRLINLHIAPYFPDSEYGVFAIENGVLTPVPLGNDPSDAQQKLLRLKAEAKRDYASSSENQVVYPEGVEADSLDYGDTSALSDLEKRSRYFNPFLGKEGSYNTINANDFEKSKGLYRQAVDGKYIATDNDRDQLLHDPFDLGKLQAWVKIEEPSNEMYLVWPISAAASDEISADGIVNQDKVDIDQYISEDGTMWKTRVYVDDDNNYVVDVPYFINLNSPTQVIPGITVEPGKQRVLPRMLRAPVSDPEDLTAVFYPAKNRLIRSSKGKTPSFPLVYGKHYTLDPETQNRQITWLGEYTRGVKQTDTAGNPQPTLTLQDRIEFKFSQEQYGIYFSASAMPLSKAMDVARDRWRDHAIGMKRRKTTKNEVIQADVDLNGIARIQGKPAMDWYRENDSTQAKAFARRFGSFECSRPVRSAVRGAGEAKGSEKRVPCPNKAVHSRMPRTIIQTKKAKVFIRDRQGKFADYENLSVQDAVLDLQSVGSAIVRPKWTWVNGAAVKLRDVANSSKISNWFGGQGADLLRAQADIAERKGGEIADRVMQIGSHAGGMCHPCWMTQYDIVPKKIFEDMWADLSEIEGIATKMLVKSQLDLEQSGYEREMTGRSGASYSPRGYKSDARKEESSKVKKLRIRKRAPGSDDYKTGYAYLEDEFGEKSYGWIQVMRADQKSDWSKSFKMLNWVQQWMQENPESANFMKLKEEDPGSEEYGMGMMRITLSDVDKSNWSDLLKFISSKHREEGGDQSGWRDLDPDQAEQQVKDHFTGFKIFKTREDAKDGTLVIRYNRAFGPREAELQTWKHAETGKEFQFETGDIESVEPMSRSFGKGYERSVGRPYQITMPDGSPRVVEIINFDENDTHSEEEYVKVRFLDQANESIEDNVVEALMRVLGTEDPAKLRKLVLQYQDEVESYDSEDPSGQPLFQKVRGMVSEGDDDALAMALQSAVLDWRTAYRDYMQKDSDEQVLPRSVLGEEAGGPVPLDTRIVKMLILEKLTEFYINYLALGDSFWEVIKKEIDNLDGMQDNQKIRLVGRLISWHEFLSKQFNELTDPHEGMLEAGVTPKDFNGPAGIPWFSVAVQRFMRQVGNFYFWTQYLKRRYGNRAAMDMEDPAVVPITQLTRKDVRDRQSYYAALNDTGYKPSRVFSLSNYHQGNLNREKSYGGTYAESVSVDLGPDRVLIYNVKDARYLNGLTGIVEGKHEGNWIVQLDENDQVEPGRIVLGENEVLFFNGMPANVLTEAAEVKTEEEYEEEYKDLMLEEAAQDKFKDDVIDLIGEFTSEHASWD